MNQATINTFITAPSKSSDVSQVLFKISVQVIGIKKRCRKSERHFFQVSSIPYNDGEFDKAQISDLVKTFLTDNMKAIHSVARIHLDHTIVTKEEVFTQTLWEPFSSKNVKFDLNIVIAF